MVLISSAEANTACRPLLEWRTLAGGIKNTSQRQLCAVLEQPGVFRIYRDSNPYMEHAFEYFRPHGEETIRQADLPCWPDQACEYKTLDRASLMVNSATRRKASASAMHDVADAGRTSNCSSSCKKRCLEAHADTSDLIRGYDQKIQMPLLDQKCTSNAALRLAGNTQHHHHATHKYSTSSASHAHLESFSNA